MRWACSLGWPSVNHQPHCRTLIAGQALIAEAENFGVVAGEPETVFRGDFIGPLFHRPAVDLYGATALGAHQVMVVVAIAAMPVEAFAVRHVQHVNCFGVTERLEGAVNGGQAYLEVAF